MASDPKAKFSMTYEARFFAMSVDMLCIADGGHFIKVNPAAMKILGYSESELYAKPVIEFIHPDDREITAEMIRTSADHLDDLHMENRYLCKDGSYRLISWTASLENGVFFAVGRDITASRQAE
ncbi:MAG: PAS domain S-box protein, partial [Proteobacteria bacterium]